MKANLSLINFFIYLLIFYLKVFFIFVFLYSILRNSMMTQHIKGASIKHQVRDFKIKKERELSIQQQSWLPMFTP